MWSVVSVINIEHDFEQREMPVRMLMLLKSKRIFALGNQKRIGKNGWIPWLSQETQNITGNNCDMQNKKKDL